tara:strand:- start:6435 stop:6848 length:414 start_codon:yes stop_codon:yes gene_type:complete
MNDPQLDQLHKMVADRNFAGLPSEEEQDLRDELIERYFGLIQKMAQAHLFQHNLYRVAGDAEDVQMLEFCELEICGAHTNDLDDRPTISLDGFSVDGGDMLTDEAADRRDLVAYKIAVALGRELEDGFRLPISGAVR